MRTVVLLLLLAPMAPAGEGPLEDLVKMLGADDAGARDEAARRIFALGEAAVPALEKFRPADPEVARAIRALIQRRKKLKLSLVAPAGAQHIGAPLVFQAQLLNETDETYLIGLTTASTFGRGTMSGFLLKVHGKPAMRLRPDQVELLAPQERRIILEPADALRVAITLRGKDLPLRRPGTVELSIRFRGYLARVSVAGRGNRITEIHLVPGTALETPRVTVRARGRKPGELDAALRSRDRKTFQSALAELMLREDAAVLAILRRHIANPFLRVRAIQRIGAAAKADDLELLRAAAGSEREPILVRLAAISGLGNYRDRKARGKLVLLAQNARLRDAAVRALAKHKHATTIDCFVRLLQRSYHEGEWTRDALGTILDWTDKHVVNRRDEIEAFERWWREHRREWIQAQRGE